MTFQNPLAFVKRRQIPLVVDGNDITGFSVDLEDLSDLGDRYEWFGKQIKGEKVDMDIVPRSEMLKVANAVIAMSLAPDASGEQRQVVETSAKAINAGERVDMLRTILGRSFEQLAAPLSAEGNAEGTAPKPNRRQRRAVPSTDGGAKPRT